MRLGHVGAAIVVLTACGSSPVDPSGPSAPSGAGTHLRGFVHDTVSRPVPGVLVEILDGGRAGARTTSNDAGEFAFTDGPNGAVTLRASRDGFIPITTTTAWSPNPNERTRVILKPVEPSQEILPGAYTMTLISDPSASGWFGATCAGFPPELRRRSYEATIAPSTQFEGFQVRFTSPTLISLPGPGFGFALTQAAKFVGFELELGFGTGPTEQLSEHRYVTVLGSAPTAEPARSTEQSLTIPFWGTFEYCQLSAPLGGYNACSQVPAAQRVEYYVCSSKQDLMVFTKR